MKVLFVCNFGQNRSATARDLWQEAHPKDEAKALGILWHSETETRIASKWADIIFVMEPHQENKMQEFAKDKKIVNLDIENYYPYGSDELKQLIIKKLKNAGYNI